MATKVIPEKREITCDVCCKTCGKGVAETVRLHNGGLKILRVKLDERNAPAASGDIQFDLCDACLNSVCASLNETAERIQTGEEPVAIRKLQAKIMKLQAHKGDPCHYCGIPHDQVEKGPCKGTRDVLLMRCKDRAELTTDKEAATCEAPSTS